MRVGFHSPLPPERTGVADYSAALLEGLRALGRVEPGAAEADVHLYHLGNNQLHREIYRRALAKPGVAVLHDAVLQHFFLGWLTEAEYIAEFTYNYGAWTEDLARELYRNRARSATDARYFRYPMLKRIAERSRALVVHNPAAAQMARAHAESARIVEIPHLFRAPVMPPPYEIERLRAQLGCPASTLLCGVFGHLRESKRLSAILRACEKARERAPVQLLIAGAFASSDLARSLEGAIEARGWLRAGYLSEPEFWRYAAAVDVCVNLREPAAGESSGIAVRMMGIGKPVIFSTGMETARFPAGSCAHVDRGPAEEDMLTALLLWLAGDREAARRMGVNAAAWIGAEHGLERVARLYWDTLTRCYAGG